MTRLFGIRCYDPENGESIKVRAEAYLPVQLSRNLLDEARRQASVVADDAEGQGLFGEEQEVSGGDEDIMDEAEDESVGPHDWEGQHVAKRTRRELPEGGDETRRQRTLGRVRNILAALPTSSGHGGVTSGGSGCSEGGPGGEGGLQASGVWGPLARLGAGLPVNGVLMLDCPESEVPAVHMEGGDGGARGSGHAGGAGGSGRTDDAAVMPPPRPRDTRPQPQLKLVSEAEAEAALVPRHDVTVKLTLTTNVCAHACSAQLVHVALPRTWAASSPASVSAVAQRHQHRLPHPKRADFDRRITTAT